MHTGVKRIYVFDREHLDADPEEVAAALAVTEEAVLTEPPLNREYRLAIALLHLRGQLSLLTLPYVQRKTLSTRTCPSRFTTFRPCTL